MIVALSLFACGGEADGNGVASNGGAPSSGGSGQPVSGTGGGPAGGATTAGNGGTAGATAGGGAAGSGGFRWTLPHGSESNWRKSKAPLCTPGGTGLPLDLWSDERGVYALAEAKDGVSELAFNDGSGWSSVPLGNFFGLSGVPNGPLILYWGEGCGALFRDGNGGDTCISPLPGIMRMFSVDLVRTFALAGNRVLRYEGGYLTQYGKPLLGLGSTPAGLWADAEVLIVAADDGNVYVLADDQAEPEVLPLPDAEAAHSLWAFSRDDIWVGLANNRVAHYDGRSWSVQQLGLDCGAVNALWGSEGVLFAASSTFIGKIEGGEILAFARASSCPTDGWTVGISEELQVKKIWGNSSREVFFAVTERMSETYDDGVYLQTRTFEPDACGMQRLYWSDGEQLRPL